MFVLMDLEWIESADHFLMPTQLASARIDALESLVLV